MNFVGVFELSTAQATAFGACVPACVGLVAAVRTAGVPSKILPLLSLGVGVGLAVVVVLALPTPPLGLAGALLIGLAVGLAASGLWSQGKTLLHQ